MPEMSGPELASKLTTARPDLKVLYMSGYTEETMVQHGMLSGEIIVLSAIEPSLTLLFPIIGGVIAEIGGVLSHAAILAREYGVPAVVNVPDAMRRLHDGDDIELNGTTGRVRLLGRLNGDRHGAALAKQQ